VGPALDRHVALVGFMGAGKTTLGAEVARRLGRPFHDVDREIENAHGSIWDLFAKEGEAAFRAIEARFVEEVCGRREPSVIAVGGGAVETRRLLDELDVFIVFLDVDVDTAWKRVRRSRRPLAQDEGEFRRRFERRRPLYEQVADATAEDVDGIVLAAGGIEVAEGALERLGELVPGGALEVAADATVLELHPVPLEAPVHPLPPGEDAKSSAAVERLWSGLRLDRAGTLVAVGGGCTTDAAGFAAATYLRGIAWVAVPTTLVGQVDAAIGGKTALNLPEGKNLVGAFHWPVRTVIDPRVLRTLPESEWRSGMAEVVKTGLLVGETLWELPDAELVRRCAAYKTAVCVSDPHEDGDRAVLNFGHTFAHALEAAGGYERVRHGEAVALGLLAALRLSGLETTAVEEVLAPEPVRVNREAAWAALARDKKARGGRPRLVLLEASGRPVTGVELPEEQLRAALDELIAD
jgi:shikimate kinase / 3-dehydroquinate synthase